MGKRFYLLFRYYFVEKMLRKLFSRWYFILFLLSILLSIAIIVPEILGRLPIYKNWHKIYEVNGSITDTTINFNGIKVEVGGYWTIVDKSGNFKLSVPSIENDSVPFIFCLEKELIVRRVNLDSKRMHYHFKLKDGK